MYAIIATNMILSFINIRKVPREVLKTEGEEPRASPSVFNTSLGTLQMLMNGKSCLIPPMRFIITQIWLCNIQRFLKAVIDIFLVFAQNIYCGYTLEPPQ